MPKKQKYGLVPSVAVLGTNGSKAPGFYADDQVISFKPLEEEHNRYPNLREILPDVSNGDFVFALNAKYLKDFCDMVIKYGENITHQVMFRFTADKDGKRDNTKPVLLSSAINEYGGVGSRRMNMLIMPLRVGDAGDGNTDKDLKSWQAAKKAAKKGGK